MQAPLFSKQNKKNHAEPSRKIPWLNGCCMSSNPQMSIYQTLATTIKNTDNPTTINFARLNRVSERTNSPNAAIRSVIEITRSSPCCQVFEIEDSEDN